MLPIETGRWTRTAREDQLCVSCRVLGDERHAIYDCVDVNRTGIHLPVSIHEIWKSDDIFRLIERFKTANVID